MAGQARGADGIEDADERLIARRLVFDHLVADDDGDADGPLAGDFGGFGHGRRRLSGGQQASGSALSLPLDEHWRACYHPWVAAHGLASLMIASFPIRGKSDPGAARPSASRKETACPRA